ncbi:MAG: class I SAM-dependent methyltransferase [Rhizomicrobium sp.]
MISAALRYVAEHPGRAFGALARNPVSVWETFHDRLVQRREFKRGPFTPDADPEWERKLMLWLGTEPYGMREEFAELWTAVIAEMESRHIPTGPMSFAGYNDGDCGFVRAVWRLVRGMRAAHVVETGVGHGITSRFILDAMERNRSGRLWSIDRLPLDPAMQARVGIAVGTPHPFRWKLIAGTSRQRLPGLLTSLGEIDIFVHDSLHTEKNVCFELERAWDAVRPGGAIVVDDIDSNWGFHAFTKRRSDIRTIVCEAEPIRPDPRRFNGKGLFGIILKDR